MGFVFSGDVCLICGQMTPILFFLCFRVQLHLVILLGNRLLPHYKLWLPEIEAIPRIKAHRVVSGISPPCSDTFNPISPTFDVHAKPL